MLQGFDHVKHDWAYFIVLEHAVKPEGEIFLEQVWIIAAPLGLIVIEHTFSCFEKRTRNIFHDICSSLIRVRFQVCCLDTSRRHIFLSCQGRDVFVGEHGARCLATIATILATRFNGVFVIQIIYHGIDFCVGNIGIFQEYIKFLVLLEFSLGDRGEGELVQANDACYSCCIVLKVNHIDIVRDGFILASKCLFQYCIIRKYDSNTHNGHLINKLANIIKISCRTVLCVPEFR